MCVDQFEMFETILCFCFFFHLGTVLSTTKRLSRVVRKCLAASDTVGNTASIFTLDAGSEAI